MKISICIFLCFLATSVSAQLQNGTKILTTSVGALNLSANSNSERSDGRDPMNSSSSSILLQSDVTFGVFKNSNLFSYGMSLIFSHINQSEADFTSWRLSPVVSYERFYPIVDKLYFTPFISASVGYEFGKTEASQYSSQLNKNGIAGTIRVNPVAVSFLPNKKTVFFLGLSQIVLSYTRFTSKRKSNMDNGRTIEKQFSANAALSSVSFGLQKII